MSQWIRRVSPAGGWVQTDPGSGPEPQTDLLYPYLLKDHEGTPGGWIQMVPVPWGTTAWLAPLQWSPREIKYVSTDIPSLPELEQELVSIFRIKAQGRDLPFGWNFSPPFSTSCLCSPLVICQPFPLQRRGNQEQSPWHPVPHGDGLVCEAR